MSAARRLESEFEWYFALPVECYEPLYFFSEMKLTMLVEDRTNWP